ncbi:MAG: SHD1 domain-containing protein [Pirellulales bacterium]
MRRSLHAFLVGLLTVSFSMDAARGCWYLRHAHHAHHAPAYRASACSSFMTESSSVSWTVTDDCQAGGAPWVSSWVSMDDVVVIHDDGVVEGVVEGCACGDVIEADGGNAALEEHGIDVVAGSMVKDPLVTSAPVVAEPMMESIVVPAPVVGANAPDEQPLTAGEPLQQLEPTLAPPSDEVRQATALGDDEPEAAAREAAPPAVDPVSDKPAEEPMAESLDELPGTEPPAATPAVVPEEPNLFEEADAQSAPATPLDADTVPLAEPVPSGDGGLNEPAREPGDDELLPAREEPADDAVKGDEPAAPAADPFDAANRSGEPVRRWIDRTGAYAVVGTLVAVREDGTCVLAAAGRMLTVPLAALSDHDRDYASRAEDRLAARASRQARDTAGL